MFFDIYYIFDSFELSCIRNYLFKKLIHFAWYLMLIRKEIYYPNFENYFK